MKIKDTHDRTETSVPEPDESVVINISPRSLETDASPSTRYSVLEEAGRGGIGRVMRARDHNLDRDIAIKELLRPGATSEARFLREAKITARLQHPGIVPIYETGRWPSGEPYYAMKMVAGKSLKQLIKEAKTLEDRLALIPNVLAVVDAVAYAHSKGIIHRDLKPSNIIVGDFGETMVIDWGLAKDLSNQEPSAHASSPYRATSEPQISRAGDVLGTPAFMAPEQARGAQVDERTDVYSLGAVLYTTLSGANPYRGKDGDRIISLLLAGERVEDVQALGQQVPDDLAAIIRKSLVHSPELRYANAAALAEDLQNFVGGRLVRAFHYSPVGLLGKWIGRHKTLALVLAAAIGLVATILVTAVWRIAQERDTADRERRTAEREKNAVVLAQATESLATDPTDAVTRIQQLPDSAAYERVKRLIASEAVSLGVARRVARLDARNGIARLIASNNVASLLAIDTTGAVFVLDRLSSEVVYETTADANGGVSISNDGDLAAMAARGGGIKIWRRGRGEFVVDAHASLAIFVAVSPDLGSVFSVGLDGGVRALDLATRKTTLLFDSETTISWLAVAKSGGALAVAAADGSVSLLDTTKGALEWQRKTSQAVGAAIYVDFTNSGLVSSHEGGALVLWDINGNVLRVNNQSTATTNFFHITDDGTALAGVDSNGSVRLTKIPELTSTLLSNSGKDATGASLASINGRQVYAVTFVDGSAMVWDLQSRGVRTLIGHEGAATAVVLAADGSIVTASLDGSLRYWTLPPRLARAVEQHPNGLLYVEKSSNRTEWASCGRDGDVFVWSKARGGRKLKQHEELCYTLGFSRDGRLLASGSWDRMVHVLDLETMFVIDSLRLPHNPLPLVFSSNHNLLIGVEAKLFKWSVGREESSTLLGTFDDDVVDVVVIEDEPSRLAVVTRSSNVYLRRSDGDWFVASRGGKAVFSGRYVVYAFENEGTLLGLYDLIEERTLGTKLISFGPTSYAYDQTRGVVFAFGPRARAVAWSVGEGTTQRLTGLERARKASTVLTDGSVARIAEDGALERWDFERGEILTVRQYEGSSHYLKVVEDAGLLVSGDSEGRVWAWSMKALTAEWERLRAEPLAQLTNADAGRSPLAQELMYLNTNKGESR